MTHHHDPTHEPDLERELDQLDLPTDWLGSDHRRALAPALNTISARVNSHHRTMGTHDQRLAALERTERRRTYADATALFGLGVWLAVKAIELWTS